MFRSGAHIYVQVIDDLRGPDDGVGVERRAGGQGPDGRRASRGGNIKGAEMVGTAIAERLKEKGITKVVFDRNGFLLSRPRARRRRGRAVGRAWSFRQR